MSGSAIALDGVTFAYGATRVLEDVSLEVPEGEFLGIVGPNAGGKSTLLKLILGLLEPTAGRVRVLGRAPAEARHELGYLPQYPAFARDFPVTVGQVVLTGRLGRRRLLGGYGARDREMARWAMTRTEVADLAGRRIGTLSGGQLQRVLLARALACEPKILILDEPTSNIDQRVESDIFDLLRGLNRHITILVVSHDIAFISAYVHRVACLNRTLICHRTEAIDGGVIRDLYGGDVRRVAHSHSH
ncbi:MAG: ABC transporter ATP-binding protein [Gammaproteobacteria bacterium]|jgi:zinc transport system ATP-binding protein|nr:ABC transporter ATP-binding protein [Gammaproteobacteria bacterium]